MGGRGERSTSSKKMDAASVGFEHKTIYSQRGKYKFEYDSVKSKTNKEKHGIDFEEAQKLWDGKGVLTDSKCVDEHRCIRVAKLGDKHYTSIYAERGDSMRIISVRRARESEVIRYEAQNH